MMKLESTNRQDWQGFSRILEVMSFVDEIDAFGPEETREIMEKRILDEYQRARAVAPPPAKEETPAPSEVA